MKVEVANLGALLNSQEGGGIITKYYKNYNMKSKGIKVRMNTIFIF